jgi:hypothetical protein
VYNPYYGVHLKRIEAIQKRSFCTKNLARKNASFRTKAEHLH